MKKVCVTLLAAAAVLAVSTNLYAIPVFKKTFDEKYVGEGADPALKSAVDQAKCNVCHFGTVKKNRNDYGHALSKYLKKDNFKADRLAKEPDVVKKEVLEALQKVEAEKNPTGETYGDRLKAGKLPGTVDK